MTVTNLYLYHSLQFIHNNIGSYVTNPIIHNYNTRNAKLLRPPRHHLYMTEKNSVNISHYNRLPVNLKKLNTYLFKKKLMSFFKSHCFYTVKDFESFESSSICCD
nr:unnamed protein product [Callosobruchus analis]